MNSLDLDLDTKMNSLEFEWRQAYEASIDARAAYQSLAANPASGAAALDESLEKLDRAENRKARILMKIEQLELSMLGRD